MTAQGYRFREVRSGERDEVLAFARQHGFELGEARLKHHLSLVTLDEDKQIIAASLCTVDPDGRFVIKVLSDAEQADEALVQEMANRCLRKVQSQTIGIARINSPSDQPAEALLAKAGWLDRIQETAPPDVKAQTPTGQSSQAA